jgi:hypothetical protein
MDKDEDFLEFLILEGAVEVAGYDPESNDFMYSFTEKAQEIIPNFIEKSMELFNKDIYYLWERGFLQVDMTQSNPLVRLLPKALDSDEVKTLSQQHRITLQIIIEALRIE